MFDQIASYENLLIAFKKAYQANRNKNQRAYFFANQEKFLSQIHQELLNNSYRPKPYRQFVVYEPKRRQITAPAFYDRIVHHALVNVIEPIFETQMYPLSFACRKNMGNHKAVNLAQQFLKENNYVLKGDISSYFPSIDQEILIKIIEKQIKDYRTLDLIKKIIYSYHSEKGAFKGLPIGNLTSQLFANVYLTEFDWFIDNFNCSYIRYLDDWLIFAEDKEILWRIKNEAEIFLTEKLKLVWHYKKCLIHPTRTGVPFLGFFLKPNKRRLKQASMIKAFRHFKAKKRQLQQGIIRSEEFNASWQSWLGHVSHSDLFGLILAVKKTIFQHEPISAN